MQKKNVKPTKRKDGRYVIRIMENGKSQYFYGKTSFEAKSKYNQFLSDKQNRSMEVGSLSNCIYDWLVRYKFGKIRNSSYDRLESTYVCHVKPDIIGRMQIHDITTDDLQDFIDRKAYQNCDGRTLTLSSLKKIKELLAAYFKFAYEQNIISFNPTLSVRVPIEDNMVKKTKKVEELPVDLLSALYEDNNMKRQYNAAFIILLNTGLRIGELIALTWDDIDFEKNIIHVQKTFSTCKNRNGSERVPGRVKKEGTTKTQSGIRFVPINSTVRNCLNMILENNERKNILTDYVISTSVGTCAAARNVQRGFDEWLAKRNFKHYNLHCFRHTFGSIMIRKGIDVKVVSELMGHSNVQTTYNIYIHVIKEQKAMAVKILDEIV